MTPEEGSVTLQIGNLKTGGDAAAQLLWERYFDRLVQLAHTHLRARHGGRAVADEEDAALSAFKSFCHRAARGQFPNLADRDELWRLLVFITIRKVSKQVRRERAKKRGGKVFGEAAPPGSGSGKGVGDLGQAIGPEPTPEFAVQVAEEYRRRLDALGDEMLRQIAVWKLEGYPDDEVAQRLGCARRTVQRKLSLIRQEWGKEVS